MQRTFRPLLAVFVPILTLGLGWQLGMRMQVRSLQNLQDRLAVEFTGGSGSTVIDPEKDVDPTLLWTTWKLLLKNYIAPEKLEKDTLLFGAVSGMVKAVGDPYTVFMDPKENDDFRRALSGDLEGIGAELGLENGVVVIVSPLRGSPAQRAGLLPGDRILTVDDVSMDGKNLQEVVQLIRGPGGTTVTLEIARDSTPVLHTFSIVRESIHIPSAEWRRDDNAAGNIGILALNQFGDDTVQEAQTGIAELQTKALKGLILDLRYNGGGYLDGAVDLVSLFLQKGKVVTVERREGAPQIHYVSGRSILPDLPMVVLINEGSASASEIAAGALQDNSRATVIGVTSFGKGTVQEVIDLPGGSSLRVTIARWLTPGGKDLSKEGVHPDYVVEQPAADTLKEGEDPQLQAAIEYLRTGKKPASATSSSSASAQ